MSVNICNLHLSINLISNSIKLCSTQYLSRDLDFVHFCSVLWTVCPCFFLKKLFWKVEERIFNKSLYCTIDVRLFRLCPLFYGQFVLVFPQITFLKSGIFHRREYSINPCTTQYTSGYWNSLIYVTLLHTKGCGSEGK